MYLEHFHLNHPPFAEEPDPEIFFPGARREEICQSLILDILAGKALVKLVGREGSGKTLICRLIAERLPAEFAVIRIDNPIGSFDDLLRIASLDLGMDFQAKGEAVSLLEAFSRVLKRKQAERVKVVLIIDEAEKLFLATLERLVRHIGEQEEDQGFCVLLAGRPGLDANLDQLAGFCASVAINAGYVLAELTESETRQYLRYRVNAAGMSREQFAEVFTEGAVLKIFDSARGNLRMINILAEQVLQASCAEKSFMVLLDHVEPEAASVPRLENRVVELYELLRGNRLLAGLLVGAVLVVFATGLLLMGGGERKAAPSDSLTDGREAALPANPDATQPGPLLDQARTGTPAEQRSFPAGAAEQRDGEKLFRERLTAGARWLAGISKGGYTIQLMMLGSDQAQASIAATLALDEYYLIRDQLYILRKKTTPPTLFVFHGMYDTLEAAREARNNLPLFLRKHHPYPLAVGEAIKKIEN